MKKINCIDCNKVIFNNAIITTMIEKYCCDTKYRLYGGNLVCFSFVKENELYDIYYSINDKVLDITKEARHSYYIEGFELNSRQRVYSVIENNIFR